MVNGTFVLWHALRSNHSPEWSNRAPDENSGLVGGHRFDYLHTSISEPRYPGAFSGSLPPGDYALIFGGAGLFGATGEGSMPDNNVEIPGNASVFLWSERRNAWLDETDRGARFVIKTAVAVPDNETAA